MRHVPRRSGLAMLLLTAVAMAEPGGGDRGAEGEPGPTDPLELMLVPYRQGQAWLRDEVNLELAFGTTLVFQHATDTIEPDDSLLTMSYDLAGYWPLVNPDAVDEGALGFLVEGGFVLSHDHREDLAANLGSGFNVNDDLDNQEIAVTELWWQQHLADDAIVLTLGKLDPTVPFDNNRIANDETTQFLSSPLVNNPAIAFPDNGLGGVVRFIPRRGSYVLLGVTDARADARETGFATIDRGDLFAAGEVGVTIQPAGLGEGTYRAMLWRSELDDTGWGAAVSLDQHLGGGWVPFARYGYSEGDLADFQHFASVGIGLEAPLGRADDLVALGVAWGEPVDEALRDELLVELFRRVQVTPTVAVTPDVQVIVDPADPAADDVVGVLGVRVQATFRWGMSSGRWGNGVQAGG